MVDATRAAQEMLARRHYLERSYRRPLLFAPMKKCWGGKLGRPGRTTAQSHGRSYEVIHSLLITITRCSTLIALHSIQRWLFKNASVRAQDSAALSRL